MYRLKPGINAYMTCSVTASKKSWQGYTLLELLLALCLSSLIIYAVFSLHQVQRTALQHVQSETRRAEAGFTALHLISTHLRFAGFTPALHKQKGNPIFGCSSGRPMGPMGYTYCKADQALYSDGLEVAYVADSYSSGGDEPIDCLGQALASNHNEGSKEKKPFPGVWSVQRFFVQNSKSTGQPELYCDGSGRLGTAQPIVEGVEQLRVLYRLAQANEAVDAAALAPHQWAHVAAVELCVVVRDVLEPKKAKKPSYIGCDGLRHQAKDGKKRSAFSTWVAIPNQKAGMDMPLTAKNQSYSAQ